MNKEELRKLTIAKLDLLLDKYKDDYDLPFENVIIELWEKGIDMS